jgi:hypothetical protein
MLLMCCILLGVHHNKIHDLHTFVIVELILGNCYFELVAAQNLFPLLIMQNLCSPSSIEMKRKTDLLCHKHASRACNMKPILPHFLQICCNMPIAKPTQ